MDSIRGRFSLSTTNLTSPIAESTCLNGISSRSKFNWGETTINSRTRNNSHSVVDQNNSMSKNTNGIPTKVSMSPSSRIDPRTYVDIHSNGLVSRIVKYHDNSARLNRSLSMTNLYNKPGQFPVVHLKKNEQQYKAKKTKNLSMTRIAAPEKSAFHGNTLSSILRSGSIVGLQKSDEEISRENRPILHPPATENEMAPTRSVLEVLKEISRKRINSDEMDGTELTKKQCKEPEQDTASNVGHRTQSKRQREITNSSASNAQLSPEQQVIKKRMCNYNNDIMSSLSSSMASVNKKKMLEIQSQKRTASDLGAMSASNISSTEFERSPTEKQRCIEHFEIRHSDASTRFTPITPLLSAPYQNMSELDGDTRNGIVTRRASEPALSNIKPKLTLFNKDYDEVPTIVNNDTTETKEGDLCGIQFVKPKKSSSISSGGSLLMEKTKKSKLALMLSGLKGELDEEDEVDTVLPKEGKEKQVDVSEITQVTSAPNITSSSLFSTMTTSVAVPKPSVTNRSVIEDNAKKPTELTSDIKLTPSTVTSTNSITSSAFKTNPLSLLSTTSTILPQVSIPAIVTSAPISSIPSTTASNPVAGGFSFGLSTPKTATTATTSSAILLPSSSISQAICSTATTSASTSNSSSGTNSITGTKLFAFAPASTQISASSTTAFTFGASTTTSQSVPSTKEQAVVTTSFASPITKATDSAPAVFGQSLTSSQPTFSFGSSQVEGKTPTNTLATKIAAPAITNALTANFGSEKNTWSSVSTPTPVNTNTIKGIGSFGAGNLSSLPQSTTVLTSTSPAGGFSFAPNSSTEATKSLFGNIATTNTNSTNSNAAFSFSANKTPANATNSISAFTFGAGASPSPAAVSTTALSFGTTVSAAATNTNLTFGTTVTPAANNTALTFGTNVAPAATNVTSQNLFVNAANPKPSNTFSFGSTGTSQNGSFPFSSTDKPPAAVPATGSSVGGFSFSNPPINFIPVAEPSKNIFGAAAPTSAETKAAFNFGSSTTNNRNTDKPVVFGGSTNIFGAPATSSAPQTSAFTFGSSSSETTNQGPTASNPFGSAQTSNLTNSLGVSAGSNSIFGAPAAAVAPLQQSSTFNFGASSSNTKQEINNPAGGFVFGSSSSIGSNASKPAIDMNKTFVFGDGNTTPKPAQSTNTSVFGGSNATNGVIDNKMFSFGSTAGGSNNTFAAGRQTVNPTPAFNFGGGAPVANAAPAVNNNLFAPQGPPTDRPFKKATRRLHKAN